MLLNKTTVGKASSRVALLLATGSLLATGIAPAQAADATPLFLSYEASDLLKQIPADTSFEGATSTLKTYPAVYTEETDPDVEPTLVTPARSVLKFTKTGQPWSGTNLVAPTATPYRLASATAATITMDYFSYDTVASPVTLSLEVAGSANPRKVVYKAVEADPGMNSLTFDMTTGTGWDAAAEYNQLVIFPNFAADDPSYTGAAPVAFTTSELRPTQDYEIDNVSIAGGTSANLYAGRPVTDYLLTFETDDTIGAKVVGAASDAKPEGSFEGAATSIADAPALGNGGKALKIVKAVGAQNWAGVNLIKFSTERVTNSDYRKIAFNYYSPKANSPTRVEVKGYKNAVMDVMAPQGWSKIVVDFDDVPEWSRLQEYISLAIFPDFMVPAVATNDTYYVDNVSFNGAITPGIPVPEVVKVKPAVTTAATAAGTAKSGKTLTAGKGTWTGTPAPAYTYKWLRCTVASTKAATTATATKCSTISGATKSTYKLTSADVGKFVRVLVTAKNSAGTSYSLSKTTSKVVK